MTETQIDYNAAFELFVSKDELRQDLLRPFKQSGRYYATDAFAMIFMPVEIAELDFIEQSKPKAESVVPRDIIFNIEIKISELERQLIPDMIDEFIDENIIVKCDVCKGSGKDEDKKGEKKDCDWCDATGKVTSTVEKFTGKKIPNPDKKFTMLDAGFKYFNLQRLIDVAKILGEETVIKTFGTPRAANVFKVGKATIMLMPLLIGELEETTKIIIQQ